MKGKKDKIVLIIGNGFDKAHGLKTSYFDFAIHLRENVVKEALCDYVNRKEESGQKSIISEKLKDEIRDISDKWFSYNHYERQKMVERFRRTSPFKMFSLGLVIETGETLKQLSEYLGNGTEIISNRILKNLFKADKINWFEVEKEYFELLSNCGTENEAKEINENLIEIKRYLIEYLKVINESTEIYKPIKEHLLKLTSEYHKVVVINFNYTNTISLYAKPNWGVIYLHGELDDKDKGFVPERDLIFGYGDSSSETYNLLKEQDKFEFIKFFKTVEYLMSKNYIKLLDILLNVQDNYDVSILGHSLGLCDKTVLNEIFDRPECKSIMIHKRGDQIDPYDDFKELTTNLSRIISNEGSLRKKVKPYHLSQALPSVSEQQ